MVYGSGIMLTILPFSAECGQYPCKSCPFISLYVENSLAYNLCAAVKRLDEQKKPLDAQVKRLLLPMTPAPRPGRPHKPGRG
jgi:hypothetical protein